MPDEPLRPPQAKALIRTMLNCGEVTYSKPHAMERMQKWGLSSVDCVNVLRAGVVDEAELENGSWKYKVHTPLICVVIRFISEDLLEIVTAWREKGRDR